MSHSHVIVVIAIETIEIVVTEELKEENPVEMIAIVVNQIENLDEIDRDPEVKIEKGQNEADHENGNDLETEKIENDDLEVEIGKILGSFDDRNRNNRA